MNQNNLGIIFPGQGSQSIGMLMDIAVNYPIINATFAEASECLGYDLKDIITQGPLEKLNATEITQPALLASSVALWRLINEKNTLNPAFMAGHSLGEYSALVCANAINFDDALRLVQARGRFMQEAVPQGIGAMAAVIGLDNELITRLCKDAAQGEVLSPANFNAVGQTVVAGDNAAVDRLIELAKSQGAKLVKKIPVSVPSHCALMKPAKEKLSRELTSIDIRVPSIQVIHNVDVKSHSHPDDIRYALAEQLDHPVRWVETIQDLSQNGLTTLWECGPGKVLAGLVKRIDKNLEVINLESREQLNNTLKILASI